ncbi:hypothetical protein [Dactylosporangium sp. NPDC005555]|uniref:hypothetical protein n=1 Tax=Dactylosporangium sp. NPDC005555 TaxID=3154889 RepID=UPI0033A55343
MTRRRAWTILTVHAGLVALAVVLAALLWLWTRPERVPAAPAGPVAELTADPFVSPR